MELLLNRKFGTEIKFDPSNFYIFNPSIPQIPHEDSQIVKCKSKINVTYPISSLEFVDGNTQHDTFYDIIHPTLDVIWQFGIILQVKSTVIKLSIIQKMSQHNQFVIISSRIKIFNMVQSINWITYMNKYLKAHINHRMTSGISKFCHYKIGSL